MSHQYFLTEEIPEVAQWTKENGRKLPMLRDVDTSYYLRQETTGFNLGPYERNCQAAWIGDNDPMPDDFSFQLYPDDLDRLEWYILDAMERVPLLGTQGVSRNINGPIPYAPDGLPMIGPMPGVTNAFEAHSFTFGIAQGGGAGKTCAEWIMHGETEWDMWAVDPRRYTDFTDRNFCIDKAVETYGHEYAMHFPHQQWPAARDRKLSPNHDAILKLGGQMGSYCGWERATWFAKQGDDTSEQATQTWTRNGPWEERVRAEVEAVRDHVGILDLPGFSRFSLSGEGAANWLDGKIAGRLPAVGRLTLGYFPTSTGRILTEMSIARHDEDEFTLITAAFAQWHDFEVLKSDLPEGLTLTDRTRERTALIVTGPESRQLLEKITDADLSLPWLTLQKATVAGYDAQLFRVSFAGELGWEIHVAFDDVSAIYQTILDNGATPFGMYALESMRLEKGYRAWKGDLTTDYTLLEGGLDRFINLDKEPNFPGKQAMLLEKEKGPRRSFVSMIVDAGDCDAPAMSILYKGDEIVGEVTSGGWGYRVNASIALGIVRSDLASAGNELEVEIYGKRHKATVQPNPTLWDPKNARIRA
jgi:dimethylglycine dehydrogenase